MRTHCLLITGFLCLIFSENSLLAQDLQKKINLKVEKAPLLEVLRQIQDNYGIRFSYLNNDFSRDTIYHFEVREKALSEVLDQLLEKSEAGYQQHNGQIIIKKGLPRSTPVKSPAGEKEVKNLPQADEKKKSGLKSLQQEDANEPHREPTTATTNSEAVTVVEEEIVKEKKDLNNPVSAAEVKREPQPSAEITPAPVVESNRQIGPESEETVFEEEKKRVKKPFRLKFFERSSANEDTAVAAFHFGLVYPISTHGTRAPSYVNRVSAHLLVGTAAGLQGVEFSSLGNIEKDFVRGYQFAGVFNVVRNEVEGGQFSGFLNLNGDRMMGGQFAGFLNNAGGVGEGVQAAGFLNRVGDRMEGVQAAGFMNLSGEGVKGTQAAGFMNRSGGAVEGVQAAGFLNVADSVKGGAQIAGFMNTASDVKGVQVSGFLNKASHIKGSQIGIINIADSVSGGVPIGLLSIVKNGYRRFEVYGGEDFEANLNFKIGVRQFYSIIALGVELDGNERSGIGFGFGSEWELSQRFHLNTDILSYYVNENRFNNYFNNFFDDQYLNNLNKIRILASAQLGRRFALFGGPTYSLFVSRYQKSPESPIGSNLVENTFFDQTNRNTNVKMWIGFNAGLRF